MFHPQMLFISVCATSRQHLGALSSAYSSTRQPTPLPTFTTLIITTSLLNGHVWFIFILEIIHEEMKIGMGWLLIIIGAVFLCHANAQVYFFNPFFLSMLSKIFFCNFFLY